LSAGSFRGFSRRRRATRMSVRPTKHFHQIAGWQTWNQRANYRSHLQSIISIMPFSNHVQFTHMLLCECSCGEGHLDNLRTEDRSRSTGQAPLVFWHACDALFPLAGIAALCQEVRSRHRVVTTVFPRSGPPSASTPPVTLMLLWWIDFNSTYPLVQRRHETVVAKSGANQKGA
jgi:hypothetical protein